MTQRPETAAVGPRRSRMIFLALSACLAACTGAVSGDEPGDPTAIPGEIPPKGKGPAGVVPPGSPMGNAGSQPGGPMPGAGGAGMVPGVVGVPTLTCKPTLDPGITPLSKLTTAQYRNTVRDLFVQSGLLAVADDLKALLASVPPDNDPAFSGLDNDITPDHASAFYRIAVGAAESIGDKPDRMMALLGPCAATAPLSAKCVDEFLAVFTRRAFRRPASPEELTALRAYVDPKGSPPEVVRNLLIGVLLSPRFLNHLEIEGAPTMGRDDLLQLSPWEIASRLSYTFWQSMPDEPLLQAAADGSLATDAGFNKQLDRVFVDPRTKETIWRFWSEWLRLEGFFFGFSLDRPAFKSLVAGEMINEKGHDHHAEMVREIRELTEYIAWNKKGNLQDLLTTDVSVTKSVDLSRIYKVAPWDGKTEPPRFTDGSRAGLLTRSAMLVIGEEQTNPFHRGATIRKRLLCDPLPSPDPNALPENSLSPPVLDATKTTRDRFESKMLETCRSCHVMFNDLGYVLESYDSLGRFRTMEKVFDKAGKIVGELPINATAVPRVKLDDARPLKGPIELTQRVAESKRFEPCFAQSYLTYGLRRNQAPDSADQCGVDDIVNELNRPGNNLGDVYKRIALQSNFRRKKVGAQ